YWEGAPFGGPATHTRNLVWRRSYVTEGDWSTYRVTGGKGQLIQGLVDPATGATLNSALYGFSASIDDDTSELDTVLLGLQARYFDGRVVALAGARRDQLHIEDRGVAQDPATGEFSVDYSTVDAPDFDFN